MVTELCDLPGVDAVLAEPAVAALCARFPRAVVVDGIRRAIDLRRQAILGGQEVTVGVDAGDVQRAIDGWLRPAFRAVINATGTVLHTNLGRAPLAEAAIARVAAVAGAYSNLEFDLATGRRGKRMDLLSAILAEITGAEAALVVNNNAAAVYLILRVLAQGREVLVSRGELVEIGGSFRVPDVMTASGAVLREVGCTNRTRLADYERAIGPATAMILRVHRSNFEMVGFTEEASLEDLQGLARRTGLPLCVDMGTACLLERPGPDLKPVSLRHTLAAGPDLVCFSGDKLLGGPQAGIILGARDLIERLGRDPMARALRVDKLTVAALEATLCAYRGGDEGARSVPIVAMLLAAPEELRGRAERLQALIAAHGLRAEVVACDGQVGGGSVPLLRLPGFGVKVRPEGVRPERLAERLRGGNPPVLGRLQDDALLLDVRTLLGEGELHSVAEALACAAPLSEGA